MTDHPLRVIEIIRGDVGIPRVRLEYEPEHQKGNRMKVTIRTNTFPQAARISRQISIYEASRFSADTQMKKTTLPRRRLGKYSFIFSRHWAVSSRDSGMNDRHGLKKT
jgi:hypothetical protein